MKALEGREQVISVTCPTESLASSLENMMGENTFMSSRCCIFKTPCILYRHKEEAYIPNAFSIGPFHHGKPNLMVTEKVKFKYLQGLISRSHSPDTRLRQCINVIMEVEGEVRECYAGKIGFSCEELVRILVLDACFIVELFRKEANLVAKDEDDPIFTMSCMLQFLWHDLILLENQIPWLVLERIFRLTASPSESKSLVELTLEFFGNIFSSDNHSIEPHLFDNQDIKHILDLLRKSLMLACRGEDYRHCLGWQPFPSATRIKEVGIKFRKVASSSSILDIRFRNGILEMPSLLIQETTGTIFRNLISFEQCYPNCTPRFTSYAILLSHLINTPEDMIILCHNGIIDNWLTPEDSTKLFKTLYHDSYVKEFHYLRLCEQVNGYCHQWRSRCHALYRKNNFGKPWAIALQFAVATLLILTFIQTYYIVFK